MPLSPLSRRAVSRPFAVLVPPSEPATDAARAIVPSYPQRPSSRVSMDCAASLRAAPTFPADDPADASPAERFRQIVAILAAGALRLCRRVAPAR